MTDKPKIALAILALTLIVGCIYVPFATTDLHAVETGDDQATDGITDIIEKFMDTDKTSSYAENPVIKEGNRNAIIATALIATAVALAALGIILLGRWYDRLLKKREAEAVAEGIAYLAINQGVVESPTMTEGLFIGYNSEKSTVDYYLPNKEPKN